VNKRKEFFRKWFYGFPHLLDGLTLLLTFGLIYNKHTYAYAKKIAKKRSKEVLDERGTK
jgi:hypothetical protein